MSDNKPKPTTAEPTKRLSPALYAAARRYAFTLVPNEHGGYYVEIPAFGDRIATGGLTPEEAATNAVEAIALALEWHERTGNPAPPPAVVAEAA